MGLCKSKQQLNNAVIVDSLVISGNRVHASGGMIGIPVMNQESGRKAIIRVNRRTGCVEIINDPLFGKLEHDMMVEEAEMSPSMTGRTALLSPHVANRDRKKNKYICNARVNLPIV